MKRKSAFRPSVMGLECRRLPTAQPYPDAMRNALQASFVAQADTKTNPVVFLGDSIFQFWGTGGMYPVGTFDAAFGNLGAVDFGIAGDHTDNLLYRIGNGDLNGKPKAVVVMIGVNDLLAGSTPGQAALAIGSVVAAIQEASPRSKVLLLGLLPTDFAPDGPYAATNTLIPKVNALISGLGSRPNVTYRNPGSLFKEADGSVRPGLLLGGIHPDAAGYQILANLIGPIISGFLNQGGVPPANGRSAQATLVIVPVPSAPVIVNQPPRHPA